ncbi:MAG: hypothetical protein ACLQVJ_02865 [Syntrophobacteraceae bacterium]
MRSNGYPNEWKEMQRQLLRFHCESGQVLDGFISDYEDYMMTIYVVDKISPTRRKKLKSIELNDDPVVFCYSIEYDNMKEEIKGAPYIARCKTGEVLRGHFNGMNDYLLYLSRVDIEISGKTVASPAWAAVRMRYQV